MSKRIKTFLPVLLLLVAAAASAQSAPFAGARVEMLPAAAGDLAAAALLAPPALAAKALADVPREAVSFNSPLAAESTLDLASAPFVQASREYWVEVSAAELRHGVPVYTLAPGALVRLNPAPGAAGLAAKAALDPRALTLVDAAGRSYDAGAGMELIAGAEDLAKSGAPFPAGTSAFRLRPELGAGPLELRAAVAGEGRYLMHVLDRASDVELRLSTASMTYLHGQTLTVEAVLARGDAKLAARRVEGFVTSPAGRAFPVAFHRAQDGVYRAELVLDAVETPTPGLWEAHATVDGRVEGRPTLRFARTAFGVALPAARLDGRVEVAAAADLTLRLGLEVAAAGRYDVGGVLFGTNAAGELEAVGLARAAAWLETGSGQLELVFPADLLAGRAVGAPFEVRDLRLVDQGRQGVLHRQARGLVIE